MGRAAGKAWFMAEWGQGRGHTPACKCNSWFTWTLLLPENIWSWSVFANYLAAFPIPNGFPDLGLSHHPRHTHVYPIYYRTPRLSLGFFDLQYGTCQTLLIKKVILIYWLSTPMQSSRLPWETQGKTHGHMQ